MKIFTGFVVSLFLSAAAFAAWAGPAEEVAAIAAKRGQAFNESNLDVFMEDVADNVVFTSSRAAFRIEGKEAYRAFFAQLFQNYPARRSNGRQATFRVYANDTVVVAGGYADQTWTDRNGQTTTAMVRGSTTWIKIGGRWQFADGHTSKVPGTQ